MERDAPSRLIDQPRFLSLSRISLVCAHLTALLSLPVFLLMRVRFKSQSWRARGVLDLHWVWESQKCAKKMSDATLFSFLSFLSLLFVLLSAPANRSRGPV